MALFGIFGNICVCLVTTQQVQMKTTMNLYIRNLAIADLGLLTVSFPLAIVRQELETWPLGEFFCKYIYPGSDIFYGASIWSITVIAIERYRNIVVHVRRGENSRKAAHWRIGTVWMASFVTQCIPLYIYMEYDDTAKVCFVKFPTEEGAKLSTVTEVYTLLFLAFLYIIPMTIISWTYISISRRIHQSTAFHKSIYQCHTDSPNASPTISGFRDESSPRSKGKQGDKRAGLLRNTLKIEERKRLRQNNKARNILTPLVVIFAVTMLPYHAVKVLATYWFELISVPYYWVIFSVCGFLIMVNSSMNPSIYAMVSRDFRKAFRRLFRRFRATCKTIC